MSTDSAHFPEDELYNRSVSFFSHYFVHGGWLPEENYLLDNVDAIRHIPANIINGRYDVTTPMKTAWELHKVRMEYWNTVLSAGAVLKPLGTFV